jgi:hypothetical protein
MNWKVRGNIWDWPSVRHCVGILWARGGWLTHCATSRKVAGSIPDGVIAIFHSHDLSGRSIALESTQPPTEMSTRNISCGVKAAGA